MGENIADICHEVKQPSATRREYAFGMEDKDLEVFIENVNRALDAQSMTKIDLGRLAAKVSDYKPRTITAALNREFKSPAFSVCSAIAKALGVPLYILLIPDIRIELLESKDLRNLFSQINKISEPTMHYLSAVIDREP